MANIVELGFIYFLQNPKTGEIVYIGATQRSLQCRLKSHYTHLSEALKGKRRMNNRFEYMKGLLPIKLTIGLLEVVEGVDIDDRERFYITKFREINPNLLNMTDGGEGGNTTKFFDNVSKEAYNASLSRSLLGLKKPDGFSYALSESRKGKLNPASKPYDFTVICGDKEFKHYHEIDNFIGKKKVASNIIKALKKRGETTSNGYTFTIKY